MTIQTIPAFYFIDPINNNNQNLDFLEPLELGFEITAVITPGAYSLTNLMNQVSDSMNASGDQIYTVSIDRDTRLVTISSSAIFSLLISTGSTGNSIFSTLGFNGADLTGLSSYTGDTAIGSVYIPQFIPQRFDAFENNVENISASVNESADGIVEVITFGEVSRMSFNIKYATDRTRATNSRIENNPNALSELRTFMNFLITKQELEFMIDRSNRSNFQTVFLDRTTRSKTGVGYRLRELKELNEYFETGKLVFRLK